MQNTAATGKKINTIPDETRTLSKTNKQIKKHFSPCLMGKCWKVGK